MFKYLFLMMQNPWQFFVSKWYSRNTKEWTKEVIKPPQSTIAYSLTTTDLIFEDESFIDELIKDSQYASISKTTIGNESQNTENV